jgi:O-antigen/teichoic acid export membrane protein
MALADKGTGIGIGVLAARTATTALSLVTGFLCARFLGPEGRGHLAVVQSLTVTLVPVLFLTLPHSNCYLSAENRQRVGTLIGNSSLLLLLNGLGLWLLLGNLRLEQPWQMLIAPFLWTTGAWSLVLGVALGIGRLSLLNWVEASLNVVIVVLLIVAQWQGKCSLEFVVYSRCVASLLAAGILVLVFLREHKLGVDWKLFQQCFDYGIRVTCSTALWTAITSYSGLALTYYQGTYAVGVFAFATQCAALTLVLANTLTSVYFPSFVRLPRRLHAAAMRRLLPRGALLLLACQIVPPLSSPLWLVKWIGPEFSQATWVMAVLSPGYFCLGLHVMVSAALNSRKVPGSYLGLLVSVLVLTAGLNHGLSGWGIWGAAWAFSGSALILLLLTLIYLARLPLEPELETRVPLPGDGEAFLPERLSLEEAPPS